MASITIASGTVPAPQGSSLVLRAVIPGYSGWTQHRWTGAGAGDQETSGVKTDVIGTFTANVSIASLQGTKYGSFTYSVVAAAPTCGAGQILNPNTQSCVSTSCGSGFTWNNGTYTCDKNPEPEPKPDPDPEPEPKPTPTPTPTTTTVSTSASYSGTVGSYYQVQQENTDVFHKNPGDKNKTPELLTFPMVAAGGLLALILFATR